MQSRSKRAVRVRPRRRMSQRHIEALERRLTPAAAPVILSEFMADNRTILADKDGAYSDWIELENISTSPVNLDGWGLTDDAADPSKWELPAVTLAAGANLIVFASGKDQAVAGAELHANFQLDATGEYLALTLPASDETATEFAPEYPSQLADVSFGALAQSAEPVPFVDALTPAHFTPGAESLGLNWTTTNYDDSAWISGPQGVGYATAQQGPLVTSVVETGGLAGVRAGRLSPNPFGEDQFAYVDRGHEHNGAAYNSATGNLSTVGNAPVPMPDYLAGEAYVELANDNRSAANYQLTINTSRPATAYLLLDNRLNGPAAAASDSSLDPPELGGTLQWVIDDGWQMVNTGLFPGGKPDFTGVDEGGSAGASVDDRTPPGTIGTGVGVNQFYTVYRREVVNNAITLHQQAIDISNMYTVVVAEQDEVSLAPAVGLNVDAQLRDQNASGYVRLPFAFDGIPAMESLTLSMRYDAGFVAYLNGSEIARRNAPAGVQWDSTATEERLNATAIAYEEIDVTDFAQLLLDQDTNVLAIHGLNSSAGDADFLIDARLTATLGTTLVEQYFTTPTPGAANQPGSLGFVEDTKFSVDRGFFSEPFVLEISTATSGAEIRFTTDGDPPTATTGIVYSGPIPITNTTTLRAAAFKPGYVSTNIDTQTYLFLDSVLQQNGVGLPNYANWGHAGPDWVVDPDIVNHADANNRLSTSDLRTVPTVSLVMPWLDWFAGARDGSGIYIQGTGVEKAASVEWILPSGESAFQIDAAVQIQGGSSADRWKSDKLSMRLKFKEPYGPTKLDYPVFKGAVDSFDTLILDSVLNYSWVHSQDSNQRAAAKYVQDQFVADLQNAMGGHGPHGRAVQVYINGLYWGMYMAHERPDETFASDYLGGDKDDYDVMKHRPSTPVNGTTANYAELLNLARQTLTVEQNYQNLAAKLDLSDFADYMLLNFYVGNTDWAHQNWYASYNRVATVGKWRFHSWDAEHVLKTPNENVLARNDTGGPTEIHQRLLSNPEYRVLFGDRARVHLFNGGALTSANTLALYQARMSEVDRAIVGESARWGDNSDASPRTRAQWLATQTQLVNNYFPARTNNVLNQLRSAGLYATVDAPNFSQHGGVVAPGFPLSMTGPAGATIYYTLDGSDPRLPGGPVNIASAVVYAGPVPLQLTGAVKARSFLNGQWSSLNEATFVVGQPTLAIVELNYHPHPAGAGEPAVDDGEFEFVELMNTGNLPVSLYGVQLTGVEFNFGPDASAQLASGARAVLVKNPTAFTARYGDGMAIAGTFVGSLSNSGETLEILDALDGVVQSLEYDDGGDWPGRPDGDGSSLEVINPLDDLSDPANWRPSSEFGGTPGSEGAGRRQDVVVNEILTRGANGALDAIELYNTTNQPIDVGGWLLSDSKSDYAKFVIPDGTVLPASGYRVFDEDDFNPTPGIGLSFALDGLHGEDVWLLAGDDGRPAQFVDHVEFPATPNGVSLGRWPDSAGLLFPMTANSLGQANVGPVIGDLVFSEIMYDPTLAADDEALEFVEIYNRGNTAVDLTGWTLAGGVDYVFRGGSLPAGAALTIVGFAPVELLAAASFRSKYGIGDSVPLLGPFVGRLNNGGELLQLLRPDVPSPAEPDFTPIVLVDQVEYDDDAPWPDGPNGNGPSLHRATADAFGGRFESWVAAAPTPGSTDFVATVPGDTNGDGAVNVVDLNNVRNYFGATGQGVLGDTNGDARVDVADLNAVRNNFGAGAPSPTQSQTSRRLNLLKIPQKTTVLKVDPETTDAVFAITGGDHQEWVWHARRQPARRMRST